MGREEKYGGRRREEKKREKIEERESERKKIGKVVEKLFLWFSSF